MSPVNPVMAVIADLGQQSLLPAASVLLLATAVACLVSAPRPGPPAEAQRGSRSFLTAPLSWVGGGLVTGVVLGRQPLALGWAVAAAVLWCGVRGQLRRARTRRTEVQRSREVLAGCRSLVADLEAGSPPMAALAEASRDCPALVPAAETNLLGGDVPAALRASAAVAGCGDLRLVAAAWEVSHHAGAGLAFSLRRVADTLTRQEAARRVITTELSSARATARLMAGLPLLTWLLGAGTGAAPWVFLLGQPLGLVCLVAGLVLALAGVGWIDALARRVEAAG